MKCRRLVTWLYLWGASFLSFSCGGGSPAAPAPTGSTPPNAVRTVLATVPFEIRPGGSTFKSLDNPPLGAMDATLEWGNATSPLDFFATDGRCPGFPDLQAGRCTVLARAEGAAKPKRLTFNVDTTNAVINFWIHNRAAITEFGMMEVAITTSRPVALPSATPTPTPSGPPDPRAGLPPGPVTQARVAIRSIDTGGFNYRDPQQDSAGNWIVHPGEFVVFDLTQRNGAGEKCAWIDNPRWTVRDEAGILSVRGSSNPFLLRVDVDRKGFFEVTAEVDGIKANVLSVISVAHGE